MEDLITSNTPPPDHGRLLRTALFANALYSGLSGATLVAASPFVGPWVGLDGWVLLAVGVGLVGYAAVLAIARQRAQLLPIVGRLAAGADLMWVAGAAALILIGDVLTGQGSLALTLLTAGVGILAAVQALGLRQLAGVTAGAACALPPGQPPDKPISMLGDVVPQLVGIDGERTLLKDRSSCPWP